MTGPRFAQLTYTSVDRHDGTPGGWQIVQESSDLSTAERLESMKVILTALQPPQPVSQFPDENEVAELPRRLVLQTTGDGSSVLAHAVPAGPDGTGRPGNVFNHVLIDREDRQPDEVLRPIQAWRAAGWLTPYGADAVRQARLDEGTTGVARILGAGTLDLDEVCRHVCADPQRVIALAALLDAVFLARRDRQVVVLVANDIEEGVRWLAAVTMLAPPRLAPELTFTTLARPVDLREQGLLLNVVLREDAHELKHSLGDWLEVDLGHQPAPQNGMWTLANRRQVPVSEWFALLQVATSRGGAGLAVTLAAADAVNLADVGATQSRPWWGLAVAIAEHAREASVCQLVLDVVERLPPVGAAHHEASMHALMGCVRRTTASMADAYAALGRTAPGSALRPLRLAACIERMVMEEQPCPPEGPVDDRLRHQSLSDDDQAMVARLVRDGLKAAADPLVWPRRALRMYDVLAALHGASVLALPNREADFEDVVDALLREGASDPEELLGAPPRAVDVGNALLGALPHCDSSAPTRFDKIAIWLLSHISDEELAQRLVTCPRTSPLWAVALARTSSCTPLLDILVRHVLNTRTDRTRVRALSNALAVFPHHLPSGLLRTVLIERPQDVACTAFLLSSKYLLSPWPWGPETAGDTAALVVRVGLAELARTPDARLAVGVAVAVLSLVCEDPSRHSDDQHAALNDLDGIPGWHFMQNWPKQVLEELDLNGIDLAAAAAHHDQAHRYAPQSASSWVRTTVCQDLLKSRPRVQLRDRGGPDRSSAVSTDVANDHLEASGDDSAEISSTDLAPQEC